MEIFCYGVKRYNYYKWIGIIELLEKLSLDFFNSPFSTNTGTTTKNTSPLDELDYGQTVSTCQELHFISDDYRYTEFSTISDINLNIA